MLMVVGVVNTDSVVVHTEVYRVALSCSHERRAIFGGFRKRPLCGACAPASCSALRRMTFSYESRAFSAYVRGRETGPPRKPSTAMLGFTVA